MKKTLLTILLLAPFFLTAQRSLKKAILITSSNETLSGYIDDKEWLVNPSSIRFKQSPAESFKEFKATDLKSITIENGDRYISAAVTYEETPTEATGEKMDTSLIIHKTETILLLLEYASPDFSLYSFSKNNRQHFFIQQKEEAPQELIYRSYTVKIGGSVFEREENAYWKQLNKLFGDCSQAIDKIGTLQFKEKNLTKILSVYTNECGSKKIDFVNNKKKGLFEFAVIAGLTKNSISFKGDETVNSSSGYLTKEPITSNPAFSAGLRLNYIIPKAHQKISFFADLYYNKASSTNQEYASYTSENFYTQKTLTLNLSFLRTSIGGRYNFTMEKTIRPFVQGGLASALMIGQKTNVMYDDYFNNVHHITNDDPFNPPDLKKFVPGFFAGAGISYRRFSVDYKFESTTGLLQAEFVKATFYVHSVLLSVSLSKQTK